MDSTVLAILLKPPSQPALLSVFPNEEHFAYWKARYSELKAVTTALTEAGHSQQAEDVNKQFGFFAKAIILIFLGNEYLNRNRTDEAQAYLNMFKELIGKRALDKLNHAASPKSDPESSDTSIDDERKNRIYIGKPSAKFLMAKRYKTEYEDAINQLLPALDRTDEVSSTLQFVTIHFLVGECRLMLRSKVNTKARKLKERVKFLHWMCTDYIRNASKDLKIFVDTTRHATGIVLLSCGMQQGSFEHWYLVKAFRLFEAMIDWKPSGQKKLIRRKDTEIQVCDASIEGILKLAAIFIELRQTQKARKLINEAVKLIDKFSGDSQVNSKNYFVAYANYLLGLSHFEDTCPLTSQLNAGAHVLDRNKLMKRYKKAKKCLRICLDNLGGQFSELQLTASAYALIGIVCVNEDADFVIGENRSLYYLEKAVSLESKLEANTLMADNLIQILKQGITVATTQAARDKCSELHLAIISGREPDRTMSESSDSDSQRISSAEPMGMAAPDQSIFDAIATYRQFTDGYRAASLNHWKQCLKDCQDSSKILHRLAYLLFVSRHHLRSQYLRKAECRQAKVARLCFLAFGLKLEISKSLTMEAFRRSSPLHQRELAFIAAFWTVNQGMLFLGCALEYYQQKSATEVVQIWDHNEPFYSSLVSWALYNFRSSNKISKDWLKAKEYFRIGRTLFKLIRNSASNVEIPALIFLENYLVEGFYRLSDVAAFDDRYKANVDLITTTVDLLQDLKRLNRLDRGLSEPGTEVVLLHLNSISVNFPALLNRILNRSAGKRKKSTGLVYSILELTGIFETFEFLLDHSQASDKLKLLDDAYKLCQRKGLVDTEAHALIHMQAGLQLLRFGEVNPFKPHYDSFSAAILKFRKAARILELTCGEDIKLAYCYTVLGVLYCSQMQIDDQELRCLQCLRKCASIEQNLLLNEVSPSPWLWKCLDVARMCRDHFRALRTTGFIASDKNDIQKSESIEAQWEGIFARLNALVGRNTPICQMSTNIFGSEGLPSLLAETFTDPLADWEENRNLSLKGVANLLRDRKFPEDCLPSDAEVRVYATYLNKLFSQHWELCHNGDNPNCPVEHLGVVRNHFLLGISEYSTRSLPEKNKIFVRLQTNHNLLLSQCQSAQRFHDNF